MKTIRVSKEPVAHHQAISGMKQLHVEFWAQFRDYLEQRKSPFSVRNPDLDHYPWKIFPVGRTYIALVARNGMRDGNSSVYLWLHGPNAKPHYHLLRDQFASTVKAALGPDVQWLERPNNNDCHIMLRRDSTPTDRATWPELNAWFAETLEAMNALFRPIVAKLDASAYRPSPNADGDAAV